MCLVKTIEEEVSKRFHALKLEFPKRSDDFLKKQAAYELIDKVNSEIDTAQKTVMFCEGFDEEYKEERQRDLTKLQNKYKLITKYFL